MSSRIFVVPDEFDWKQAYMAAILEKDGARIVVLIDDARQKLLRRMDELKAQESVPCDEIEAIHDASYMLQALKISLSYRCEPDRMLK